MLFRSSLCIKLIRQIHKGFTVYSVNVQRVAHHENNISKPNEINPGEVTRGEVVPAYRIDGNDNKGN